MRIPLSEEIKRAYYTYSVHDLAESVSLYDAAFDEMKNASGVSCGGKDRYLFYAISRAKPEDAATLSEPVGREYRSFPFTSEFVFSGLGAHQSPPNCSNLNTDPYGPYNEDLDILEIANEKEQAFDQAFDRLELSR